MSAPVEWYAIHMTVFGNERETVVALDEEKARWAAVERFTDITGEDYDPDDFIIMNKADADAFIAEEIANP